MPCGGCGATQVGVLLVRRSALAWRFAAIARRYWLTVYPLIRAELRRWRSRAAAIPDPELRELAFEAHTGKRGNLEGAAAFAVFAPASRVSAVVRSLVAFQAAYDYVDVLSEQPSSDTIASGYRLHLALIDALQPCGRCIDHYAHHPVREDGGYLRSFIATCGAAVDRLPSYGLTARNAREGARRIAVYQGLNNWGDGGDHRAYARWADEETPEGTGLKWWETGAAAGSSLSVFAAIAAAADERLRAPEALSIDRAYFPWIGSLHTLLDSLVDHVADVREGQHSLIEHYGSPQEAAHRMQEIAERSIGAARRLPGGDGHAMIVAAMSCFYLVAPEAHLPDVDGARIGIVAAIGDLAAPTLMVMRARRLASRSGRDGAGQEGEDCEPSEVGPLARATVERRLPAGEEPRCEDLASEAAEHGLLRWEAEGHGEAHPEEPVREASDLQPGRC